MFIDALCLISKDWEKPRCHSTGGSEKQTVIHLYNEIKFSDKKE